MGKGDGHADNDVSLVSKVKCAKFNKYRNVGQHRILLAITIFMYRPIYIFLNFQDYREHVYSNL